MKIQPGGRRPQSTGFGLNRELARDHAVKRSMPARSTSKKTPKTSVTRNTVIVLCAIVALIAALAFLESHIRSIEHAHPIRAEIRSHSPKEVGRDTEARRTDGGIWMALDKSHIDR
jgi:hypothetical protein